VHQLAFLCVGIYSVMSAVVGVRLVRRHLTTRGVPELMMGLAYLAAPGSGYPLVVLGPALPSRSLGSAFFALGETGIVLGVSLFFFFNAKVFRARSPVAYVAAGVGSLLMCASGLEIIRGYVALGPASTALTTVRTASVVLLVVLGLGYTWTAVEGARHYRLMLRRSRFGLGDPLIANRFLLWAIAGTLQVFSAVVAATSLQTGGNMMTDAAPLFATSLVGVFNTALLVLIFIPPAWYTRWLTRAPAGALEAI
jgi:hypothetical protein